MRSRNAGVRYRWKLSFTALGIAVSLVICEVVLRLANYTYRPFLGLADWRPHHLNEQWMTYDRNLIWRPIVKQSVFNAQGFRGRELSLVKAAGEYRIFTIGDSNTCGPLRTLSWPEYLDRLMATEYPGVQVVNAGVWGYSSFQGLRRLEDVLRFQPDMVLISFGANDAHRVVTSDKEYVRRKRFVSRALSRIRLVQLGMAVMDVRLLFQPSLAVPRVDLVDYEKILHDMIGLAHEHGMSIVLLTRPFVGDSTLPMSWKYFAPHYNELTLRVAKEREVQAIDVYSAFRKRGEYFVDESHFTDEGNRIAAAIIYEHIRGELERTSTN